MKRTIFLASILLMLITDQALCNNLDKYIFTIKPALMQTVNAITPQNSIPWCVYGIESEYIVQGELKESEEIIGIRHGDYDYTLYRFTFNIAEDIKGQLSEKSISFFIQRRFPTPESGIELKELWPFRSSPNLRFSISLGEKQLQIDEICK